MTDKTTLNSQLAKLDNDGLSRLYMRVFNTPDGELVLQDLKNRCYFYEPYILEGSLNSDNGLLGFKDGKRAVVLSIESRLLPLEPVKSLDTGASSQ